MKRYFSIIAVMALVLCMLVGCGSKKDDTSSKSAKQEETVAPEKYRQFRTGCRNK